MSDYLLYDYRKEKFNEFREWEDKVLHPKQRPENWNYFEWLEPYIQDGKVGWYNNHFFVQIYEDQLEWFAKYFNYAIGDGLLVENLQNIKIYPNCYFAGDRIVFIFDKNVLSQKAKDLEKYCPKNKYTIKESDMYDNFIYED